MKVAVLLPAVGCPGTLAESAFQGALMEGFSAVKVAARVVGLALHREWWRPEALGECESSAPWLPPTRRRLGDRADAARRGIFDRASCPEGRCGIRWRLELLLERELLSFAPEGHDHIILADTRSQVELRLVCRVARRLGWRVVVFSNEALTDLQIDPATRDDYIRCVTRCTAGIWAVSDHLAEYWMSLGVPQDRIFVSPLVVRPSSFAEPQAQARQDSASAVYLGNLSHREVDYLIDISEAVSAKIPEFTLAIYGDAPEARRHELAREVERRGLSASISVNPPVSPIDVPAVLQHADVLLLPRSQGEFSAAGFPNKLGEYLASGRPVVVTGVGDIPKYLTDGDSAFVVAPDDTEAFAAAVVRALADHTVARAIGARGQQVARELLRADIVAGQLAAFMEELSPAPACPASGERTHFSIAAAVLPDPSLLKRDVVRLFPAIRRLRQTRRPR